MTDDDSTTPLTAAETDNTDISQVVVEDQVVVENQAVVDESADVNAKNDQENEL